MLVCITFNNQFNRKNYTCIRVIILVKYALSGAQNINNNVDSAMELVNSLLFSQLTNALLRLINNYYLNMGGLLFLNKWFAITD